MLLGHTKQINGVWKIQSLKQHSENVAEYCARACQPLGVALQKTKNRLRIEQKNKAF